MIQVDFLSSSQPFKPASRLFTGHDTFGGLGPGGRGG